MDAQHESAAGVRRGQLELEVVYIGTPPSTPEPNLLTEAVAEAARAIWLKQGGGHGRLSIALVVGTEPEDDAGRRVIVGAYSPETRTVLLFVDTIDLARGPRSLTRHLLRTLAHEVTHAVQHQRYPDARPGRRGSITLASAAYAADALEHEARRQEAAFENALFAEAPTAGMGTETGEYHAAIGPQLRALVGQIETTANDEAA